MVWGAPSAASTSQSPGSTSNISTSQDPLNPAPSAFTRPTPKNYTYLPFKPMTMLGISSNLANGFPIIPPPINPEDEKQEDWPKFLIDLKTVASSPSQTQKSFLARSKSLFLYYAVGIGFACKKTSHPSSPFLNHLHTVHNVTNTDIGELFSLHHKISDELAFRTGSRSQSNTDPDIRDMSMGELLQILGEVVERMSHLLYDLRDELKLIKKWSPCQRCWAKVYQDEGEWEYPNPEDDEPLYNYIYDEDE
ncbi:hypothetical protein BJ322DRAFT_1177392 [Thelephora terrestris]|uniref:Uncharacterized protein n=1 Tax=Thelephora terrestris TaxID=56493 RepID=A0A9P6L9H4_9AGAM|nr:hypothetical protein BJ322DRAFT_1177392 [Thelephora terrestris]